MSELSTIAALRGALEPVEALRGEHTQMEQWVRESFASLEQLHEQLNEKQTELTQREAEFARRQQEPGDSAAPSQEQAALETEVELLRQQLDGARLHVQQLERESTDQREAMDELDRVAAEMRTAVEASRAEEMQLRAALQAERARTPQLQAAIVEKLTGFRESLDRQREMLEDLLEAAVLIAPNADETA